VLVSGENDLLLRPATELIAALRSRELSSRELVEQSLERIESLDNLNAFLTVDGPGALEQAARADAALSRGDGGPMCGLPVAVKDLDDTAGMRTTYGTVAYAEHVPQTDSVIVERLRQAGAIIIGKTNTPAYGLIGVTKNRLREFCRNPWAPELTTGGSSGGSAVAVATGMSPLATGTDSGGSVSAPAGFCATVGIKPTHGRIPFWPRPEGAWMLDHLGMLARTVSDAALAIEAVAGHDRRDPLSRRDRLPDLREALDRSPEPFRFAYTATFAEGTAVDDEVLEISRRASRILSEVGGTECAAPAPIPDVWDVYTRVFLPDVQAGLGQFIAEHPEDIYPETVAELEPLERLTPADVAKGLAGLWRIRAQVADAFEQVDVICTPATAVTAFPPDEPPSRIGGREVAPGWTTFMPYGVLWNLTGCPLVTLPCGLDAARLPVGLILVGASGAEARLVQIARALEQRLSVPRLGAGGVPGRLDCVT
jgi:amidase